jgi:hypothetical protein
VETHDGRRVKISSGEVCIQRPRPAKKVFNKDPVQGKILM